MFHPERKQKFSEKKNPQMLFLVGNCFDKNGMCIESLIQVLKTKRIRMDFASGDGISMLLYQLSILNCTRRARSGKSKGRFSEGGE